MMSSRMTFFLVLACCLSTVACPQGNSREARPAPPDGSYRVESLTLTTGAAAHPARVAFVTPAFFQAVREQPLMGRLFLPEEHKPGGQEVVVLSHGLWEQRFGADRALIGKSAVLEGRARTIIGIMPKGFDVPAGTEAWLPEAVPER